MYPLTRRAKQEHDAIIGHVGYRVVASDPVSRAAALPPSPHFRNRTTFVLSFPFNQRWAMMFWSAVFNPDTRFAPDTSKSPEWNRGAYLVEALAHCGECHTPRNLAFALDNRKKFAGAVTAGWRAFNISSDKCTGVGGWKDEDLATYLSF